MWAAALLWVKRLFTGAQDARADEVRADLGEGRALTDAVRENAEDAEELAALVPAPGLPRPAPRAVPTEAATPFPAPPSAGTPTPPPLSPAGGATEAVAPAEVAPLVAAVPATPTSRVEPNGAGTQILAPDPAPELMIP